MCATTDTLPWDSVLTFFNCFQGGVVDNGVHQDPAVDSNPDTSVPSTQEMIALMSSSLASQELSSDHLTDDNLVAEDNGEHNDTVVAMEVVSVSS